MIRLTRAIQMDYDFNLKLSKYTSGDTFYINPSMIESISTREALIDDNDGSEHQGTVTEVHKEGNVYEVMETPLNIIRQIHSWYRGIFQC